MLPHRRRAKSISWLMSRRWTLSLAWLMSMWMKHGNMKIGHTWRLVSGGVTCVENLLEEILEVTEQQSQTLLIQWSVSQHGSNTDCKRRRVNALLLGQDLKYMHIRPVVWVSLPNRRSKCGAPYTWDIGVSGCSLRISAYCGLSNLYSSWVPSMTLKYSRIPATTSLTAYSLWRKERNGKNYSGKKALP